ncbi:STELLO glycosyltransferase family protein [uncultured Enterovirga sp.]|uniref:STELLO glycosyltransferase family protein n=1 Tax=uncultured Enterovirga sp. TaxID=2026352 RepID=UPI0035CA8F47
MPERYAVVITTINPPTRAVQEIARDAGRLGAEFVLIGDSKSPADFDQPGATYLDLAAQRAIGFRFAELVPERHYARKNIGYLVAIRNGATIIVETDDDNIPRDSFWEERRPSVPARVVDTRDWVNVYGYFADAQIWPRGLPLDRILQKPPALSGFPVENIYCPIQQGLADENPDVDAIYRLVLPLPFDFKQAEPVALKGAWCPFNSQNTTWWPEAFPLLYLPFHCSFRMTDIWRSFVAQRIAYLNGWGLLFHSSTVFQERNEHNLLRDFEEEVPGYLNNERIRVALDALDLPTGVSTIPEAMRLCYGELVRMDLVGAEELPLLEAWLDDLGRMQP